MQTGNVFKNTIASILVEVVAVVSGLILPQFFIEAYGSSVNGLVSSIGQFITYMGLVEAGVSAAATVELYKPLASGDNDKINEIVSAAKGFYFKSGIFFVILDAVLILGYPYIVQNEIADLGFIRMMIIVLSLNGIIDYFLLGKYRVLLTADQKTYIIAFAQSIGTLVTLFVSVLLIRLNCSPILVKSVAALVYLLRTLYIVYYVRHHYSFLRVDLVYSSEIFPQRKSALFHQIVGMICNNTDIVLLTIMLSQNALAEVSVYTAYNMVAANITTLFNSFSKGLGASYGELIAKGEDDTLKDSFCLFEFLYFIVLFVVYTCMGVLFYSFISLYSLSFTDRELYLRWDLVILFTVCGIIQNIRIPGMTVQIAAGHFKQTERAAFLEAALNLCISLTLVRLIGIDGVLIGTLISYLYRSSYVITYNARNFIEGSLNRTISRFIRNALLMIILSVAGIMIIPTMIQSWFSWIIIGGLLFIVVSGLFVVLNYLFEPQVIRESLAMFVRLIRKA